MISRSTSEAIVGSSLARSRVTIAAFGLARTTARSAPWPISPPAPVISTTGFRTTENYTERVMRYFLLALLLWSSALAGAAARAADVVRTDHARRLLPHRRPEIRRDLRAGPRRQRRPLARQPDAARRRDGPWPLPLRGARCRERGAAVFQGIRVDLRRVGNHRRSAEAASDLPRVGALPLAARTGARHHPETERGERLRRRVDHRGRSRRRGSSTADRRRREGTSGT